MTVIAAQFNTCSVLGRDPRKTPFDAGSAKHASCHPYDDRQIARCIPARRKYQPFSHRQLTDVEPLVHAKTPTMKIVSRMDRYILLAALYHERISRWHSKCAAAGIPKQFFLGDPVHAMRFALPSTVSLDTAAGPSSIMSSKAVQRRDEVHTANVT
jgi:hypothetical protein